MGLILLAGLFVVSNKHVYGIHAMGVAKTLSRGLRGQPENRIGPTVT